MIKSARVSVVTVTRNDECGLIKTAQSLSTQTYPNFQHVVVDGASTDGSVAWLEMYEPAYDLVWASEPDRGIFDAMNKGVSKADGELVVFMNSGDVFHDNDVISLVANKWEESRFCWGYGAMRYMNAHGDHVGETNQYPHRQRLLELGHAFAPHQATFVERAFFLSLGGFDEDFSFAADQEFAMRAGRLSPPLVWREYSADFLLGGVHSQSTYWIRERLYHKMRGKNRAYVLGSRIVDRLYTETMALYRETRQWFGRRLAHR